MLIVNFNDKIFLCHNSNFSTEEDTGIPEEVEKSSECFPKSPGKYYADINGKYYPLGE